MLTNVNKPALCSIDNLHKNIDIFRVDVYTKYILEQSSRKVVTQNY